MAKRYRPVERDQPFLLPPDMREWLPADHPVWLVIRVVETHLDTSAFHALRKTGGAGAAGYDPDMLLTVLIWAYAHGIASSRRMEQLCGTDVAFRVICGGNLPDHVTIARFRAAFPAAAAALFAEVLALCARLGMGRLGVVALDGMKIAASASKSANRTGEGLARLAGQAVADHAAGDAAEDELFGAGRRGDEVRRDGWSPRRRDERIAAALAGLRAEREAAQRAEQARVQAFRDRYAAGQRPGCPPVSVAVEMAQENLARVRAVRAERVAELEERYAAGQPRRGRPTGIDDNCRVRQAEAHLAATRARVARAAGQAAERAAARKSQGPARNITDPDSRLMPVRGGGFIQGYNAQNMTSTDGLIIATELTDDPPDCTWFEPMLARGQQAAALLAAHRPPASDHSQDHSQDHRQDGSRQDGIGLVLADAGYCSEDNMTCAGPDRLIAVGKHRDLEKAARGQETASQETPGPQTAGQERGGPAIQAMRHRLRTDDGIAAYRQRGHIAETPHGNIKHNMGFRQLSLRGKPKASAEWTLATAVHNLFKAITAGYLTSQALDTLTTRAS